MKKIVLIAVMLLSLSGVSFAGEKYNSTGEITSSGLISIGGVLQKYFKGCMIETSGGDATVQFYNGSVASGNAITPAITVSSGENGYFSFSGFTVAAPSGIYIAVTNGVVVVYSQ